MKKTTLALLTAALLANSAHALTVVDNQNSGTKIDFSGSVRLKWTSEQEKTASGSLHKKYPVQNNHSRFGFRITQQLGGGVYALGRAEWRFRTSDNEVRNVSSRHDFDHLYTRQLYAGFGHKQFGELVYGNLVNIADEVRQTDLPNTLSLSDGLLQGSSRRTLQYTYQGIQGLKLGAFYGGNSPRGNDGKSLAQERKDIWGLAAIYSKKIDDKNSYKLAAGITQDRIEQANISPFKRTAYALGSAYTYGKTTFGLDWDRRITEDSGVIGNKLTENEIRTLVFHRLTNDWRAYAMYAYKTNKLDAVAGADSKEKRHQILVGTEYFIVPKYLKGFVEFQNTRSRNYVNDVQTNKKRTNVTVVGLRAYW